MPDAYASDELPENRKLRQQWLKDLAEELRQAMEETLVTPESMARVAVSQLYGVPNDDEHIRIDRAEEVDGSLYIDGAVKLERPAHFIKVTITGPAETVESP